MCETLSLIWKFMIKIENYVVRYAQTSPQNAARVFLKPHRRTDATHAMFSNRIYTRDLIAAFCKAQCHDNRKENLVWNNFLPGT